MKKYWDFLTESKHDEIDRVCRQHNIENYTINEDGSIDVEGDVTIRMHIPYQELPLKFRRVLGNFDCSNNTFRTLEGSPDYVAGNFDCSNNLIKSLKGGPKEVGGVFDCCHNELKTLEGGPESVTSYTCRGNKLVSLKGCPSEIPGYFSCTDNELKTLEGGPVEVGNNYECYSNQLTSLVGGPRKVRRHFQCDNNNITSLEGCPEITEGNLDCSDNELTDLIGCPERLNGWSLDISNNRLKTLEGFPLIINAAKLQYDMALNPVEEVYNLLMGNSEHPEDKLRVIEAMNEEMPIYPNTMEVSYTILCEIWEANNETPIPSDQIEFENYTLVE